MSENHLAPFTLPMLEGLYGKYATRNDAAGMARVKSEMNSRGVAQTPDMANCGKLWPKVVQLDTSGLNVRPAVTWVGDNMAWMKEFMTPGRVGRFRQELVSGEHSFAAKDAASRTVTTMLSPGERIQIVKD